ncbi:MAG: DNA gyrase/topoisomerase IV subunit A [Bacteroidales bacterium]|nr:DNA gyrase/topoisomerase IV subunit A [Bacteroidales bacterium]
MSDLDEIDDNASEIEKDNDSSAEADMGHITYVSGMYENWFLDYASYVIMERAVPHLFDGLKPVQRRIMHSMKRMDDGRYNKVANIIGHTMQFHPHGDASIGDALVGLGQKDLLIDMQGNWGNIYTGDGAAAARYIEARLSKFANDVVFNPKTTKWKSSYDGRNKEPITLPVKFPLLLAQGVEGIAVGLKTTILPHNFLELIDACIAYLKNEDFEIFPDFPTGGFADCSKYNDGLRGGKVKIRAKISKLDNKTLIVTELPFGNTTQTLIDSILKANDKGTIKIKKVDDNTAAEVEILIHLAPGVSPDETIDALYVFTNCEVSVSPDSCIIFNNKPTLMGVKEMLKHSANHTVELLKEELRIRMNELKEDWMKASLEKIFILNEIYEKIKPCKTEEAIIDTIFDGLQPYIKGFWREVTREDCVKLSNIPIKRISKFSSFAADDYIKNTELEMDEVQNHIDNIIDYTINYYNQIRKKYGKGKERKTELRFFELIEATQVAVANTKLYVNYEDGFIGTSLKKDTFLFDCSDLDDVIIFREDGTYYITKVCEKAFVGKNVIHIGVFKRNDERTIYNAVYRDGETGIAYQKRFPATGLTRDKEYNITKGTKNSKILYFTANPNGEAEIIRVHLRPRTHLKKASFEFDFSSLSIRGRSSLGNILTKHQVLKIQKIEEGISTLGGRKIWYDPETRRLNDNEHGNFLGEFKGADKILVITKTGKFALTTFDLSNHYEEDIYLIQKYEDGTTVSAVFFDGEQDYIYVKRFKIEESLKYQDFIGEHDKSVLYTISLDLFPQLEIIFGGKHAHREKECIDVDEFIGVKGFKAKGKRLSTFEVKTVTFIEPLEKEIPQEIEDEPINDPDTDEDTLKGNYEGKQQSLF